ncbi:MAG: SDR family NAD(P)-dependent oxidoreductase [Rhodoferax sp.]|nr:SDR family NAD(P)-dependent oxidoreductase [Rhodoferax sp.]
MKKHLTILTGASRGMGLAIARQLLHADTLLLCISRHSNAVLQQAAQDCGAELLQWQADLRDAEPVAGQLAAWLGGLDSQHLHSATLINNAGVIAQLTALRHGTAPDLRTALRVGLEAPMLLCAAFLGATQDWQQVQRKVLNVSSGLGRRAMAASAAYCAAKAGMDHFTRCLALEEASLPHGAKVCSLAPGVVDTDMQMQLRNASDRSFSDQPSFVALQQKGQLSSPADAARRLLAYLQRQDFGAEPVADVRG